MAGAVRRRGVGCGVSSERVGKLLFGAIALTLFAVGLAAIVLESHTGSTKRHGLVSIEGDDAVWMGKTLMLLGLMPLMAWVPRRFIGLFAWVWGVGFLGWVFFGVFSR